MAQLVEGLKKFLLVLFLAGLPWVGVAVAGICLENVLSRAVSWNVGDSIGKGLIVLGISVAFAMVLGVVFIVVPQVLAIWGVTQLKRPAAP